jgi:hypothetical protein
VGPPDRSRRMNRMALAQPRSAPRLVAILLPLAPTDAANGIFECLRVGVRRAESAVHGGTVRTVDPLFPLSNRGAGTLVVLAVRVATILRVTEDLVFLRRAPSLSRHPREPTTRGDVSRDQRLGATPSTSPMQPSGEPRARTTRVTRSRSRPTRRHAHGPRCPHTARCTRR